jgi:hypothetical protein
MNKYQRFRQYAEEKQQLAQQPTVDATGDRVSGKVNQQIPKPPKLPQHLKLSDRKDPPLGGHGYEGQFRTDPTEKPEEAIPYKKDKYGDQTSGPGIGKGEVLVAQYKDNKPKSGFAFKSNDVQTAKNSASLGEDPDLKYQDVHKPHKLTSEQFIEQTKDLSPAEFISFFVEGSDEPLPTVTDLYGNEFTPDPTQTIQYLASLMVKNPRLITRLVREIKRHENGFGMLMDENQNHPEFYHMMVKGMVEPEEGKKRCSRLTRAMNDQYMDELNKVTIEHNLYNERVTTHDSLPYEEGGEDALPGGPQNPSGMSTPMKKPQGGPEGSGGAGMGTPPMGGDGFGPGGATGGGGVGGSPIPAAPGGGAGPPTDAPMDGGASPDMGGLGGPPGAGGPGGLGAPPGPGGPEAGMPGAAPGGAMPPGAGATPPPMPPGAQAGGQPMDMGTGGPGGLGAIGGPGGTPNSSPGMKKFMGETAHGNMIESMSGYPEIHGYMVNHCLTCHDKEKPNKGQFKVN